MLFFGNGESFATGSTTYTYRPVTNRETSPRIILPVRIEDFETNGFVDTGGVYLLFSPEVASYLGLRPEAGIPDDFPCVLGMSGCLERLRFAVDPTNDAFYFGEKG